MRERTIEGFNDYTITNSGEVKRNGQPVSLHQNGRGYLKVFLVKNGKRYSPRVHRLVAETFIPNPNNLPIVNHIDGNKFNNSSDNLEWVTHRENSRKFHENSSTKVKPIVRVHPNTGKPKEFFGSIRMAARYFGYDYRGLFEAVKQQTLYKGYLWKYCSITILLQGEIYAKG